MNKCTSVRKSHAMNRCAKEHVNQRVVNLMLTTQHEKEWDGSSPRFTWCHDVEVRRRACSQAPPYHRCSLKTCLCARIAINHPACLATVWYVLRMTAITFDYWNLIEFYPWVVVLKPDFLERQWRNLWVMWKKLTHSCKKPWQQSGSQVECLKLWTDEARCGRMTDETVNPGTCPGMDST